MTETREIKIKRLRMRSWRRGIKEMDLILGGFADNGLSDLSDSDLDLYDRMLAENDHDLYQWASGQCEAPEEFSRLLAEAVRKSGAV
ncbi:MAG: succinate dehydrogenase assembly factor 2 [Paracoccaceae bacterium]